MMALKLPDSISSACDLQAMILDIKTYATWFGQTAVKQRLSIQQAKDAPELPAETAALIRNCAADSAKGPTRQDLDRLVGELETLKTSLPSLTITLAAPPTGTVKRELVAWCRSNIADNVLVSFKFNSTLLGGMVLRYGSRVFDWSFRRKILASKDTFPQYLRSRR